MNGISISPIELIIKGIPEGFLVALAIHVFTRTKINVTKYLLLAFVNIATTYLIRFLPITLGVNTVLSLLILILIFQAAYKIELSKFVWSIASAVVIMTSIIIAEVLNLLLLNMMFGETRAEEMLNSSSPLTKSISTIPSTIFIAVFILAAHFILKAIDKKKKVKHGSVGKEAGK